MTYNYDGRPGIMDESALRMAKRANNATPTWSDLSANVDTGGKNLTKTDESYGEYILGSSSNQTWDDLPPAAPRNLQANPAFEGVVLTWDANTELDFLRYRIYGDTAPNPTAKIDSVEGAANTTITIKDLIPGTTYYFRLTAVNNTLQESGVSNEVNATPTDELFTDISAPLVGVAWSSVAWGDYDNDGDLDILLTGHSQSGIVTRIYRNNAAYNNTVPLPPNALASSVRDSSVTFSWSKSTDNETPQDGLTYNIRVGTTPGGSEIVSPMADVTTGYRKIPALGNTNHNTQWAIRNLPAGKYYWSVQAIDNAFAGSPFADEQTFTIGAPGDTIPPVSPRNLQASVGDRQASLKWDANSEPDFLRYRIYSGTAPGPTTAIDSVDGASSTTRTITGLTNGITYYFRITAVDVAGNESEYSNEVSVTPAAADLPPAPPQDLQATPDIGRITLSWSPNTEPDFLRYRIYGGTSIDPITPIDSVDGAANTSKTLSNLMTGTTYYFRLTAVDTALQESGYSNTVSATPVADNTPPTLSALSFSPLAEINTDAPVTVTVSDASGVKGVRLYYRAGGDARFASKPMIRQNDGTYFKSIPAVMVTNRGVEFYVWAEDIYGNAGRTNTRPVRVHCPNGITSANPQPRGTEASDYHIFSIPLDLDDKSPQAFLSANPALNEADTSKYRWYGFNQSNQILREYPDFPDIFMSPSAGFPLLVNIKGLRLSSGSGTTLATTGAHSIHLQRGWSLIGNPFNFEIPFDSLSVSAGRFELWSFESDWRLDTRGLEPWKGYAIWLSREATFSIRPGVAGIGGLASIYSVDGNTAQDWLIQIVATNGRTTSRFNFAGQHEMAADGDDALDLHQPIRIADQIAVVFKNEKAGDPQDWLTADIRQPSATGHTWEFTCLMSPDDEVLSLEFDGIQSIPQSYDVFLVESGSNTAYNLRQHNRLSFATRGLREKRFTLITGTPEFLGSQTTGTEFYPSQYELLQNFPNPFNAVTQIVYTLPQAAHVELSLFNATGQLVARLVNEPQESGTHAVVWNAEEAGSGVYLIRLAAGGFTRTKKCILLQ